MCATPEPRKVETSALRVQGEGVIFGEDGYRFDLISSSAHNTDGNFLGLQLKDLSTWATIPGAAKPCQ